MGVNKLEKYEIKTINRSEIHEADYNPRKITDSARKKLKRGMKTLGLLSPIIVNKTTMNIVGGHQRISIMDEENKYPEKDYELTVAMVELSEQDEVKANVLLNNQGVMGEWDISALGSLKDIFPDLNFETDFGFDTSDIDIMFGKSFQPEEKKEIEQKTQEFSKDDFREMKREQRAKAKEENEENGAYHLNDNDYAVTFVFPNNREKQKFMERIKKPQKETHLKATVLYDIYRQQYNLSDIGQ
jgi:hypothetical protein